MNIEGSSFVEEGKTVELICSSSSNLPNVNVTWFKSDVPLLSSQVTVALRYKAITRNHSGEYRCEARVPVAPSDLVESRAISVKVVCKFFVVVLLHISFKNF